MYEIKDNLENVLDKEEFAKRLDAFLNRFSISVLALAEMCEGTRMCSKTTFHRLRYNRVSQQMYLTIVPILEQQLEKWMVKKFWGYGDRDYHLTRLFPHRKEREMIINRCELPAPVVKFFGLKADPFDVDRVPGEDEIFANKDLDDVAARLRDAVLYKRFIACVGSVGSGKTSMKIRIARELSESRQKVHLIYPEFFDMNVVSVGSIASYILDEFDITSPRDSTIRVRKIKQLLTSLEKDDARVALVFDECHRLNEKVLIALKNFWEMTNGGYSRLLGIVLFGQPRFVEATLRDYKFREIAERVQVVEMPSIEKSAKDYLAHKIAAVGGDIDSLFEPKAVQRICSVAKTPLALGNLANSSLTEAFKLEEKQVVSQMLNLPDVPKIRNLRAA